MGTALVTGLTGQDGGYLAEQLVAAGDVVHGVVSSAQDPDGVPGHLRDLGDALVVHEADLRDLTALTALVDDVEPDRLFNLAGMSSVAASWEDPVGALEVNARPVLGLLEHLHRRSERGAPPTRFVQASSAEVFAGCGRTPIDESCPVTPLNPYGSAKALAHQSVGMYRARGLHASSLVLFNHESPRRPTRFVTRKITAGVAAIAAGRADRLTLGNLAVHRDWGWAPDYTRAMVLAAAAATPDDYVVATGRAHSLFDLVETAFAQVGITDWRPYVVSDAALIRPADAEVLVGDSTRLRTRLGWAPTVDFDGMVAAMVAADVAALADELPG
ncbi:GDPmannose 4,6-dehydratase [Blastococcus aggregatus]|uniref:GDP-mannose 4,6-dehydratase n=1 Tax=Blastococcus aggregatus TaxID=38502 RepID=A0A285V485_9ACTN|nr:GDPmannose 4,6-dehydratase [Blastococcus aggregatus]